MLISIVAFILVSICFDIAASPSAQMRYMAIVALIAVPIFLRAFNAIRNPEPKQIGIAIGTALRSLILFDAAFAYLFSQCQVIYPLVILLLLIPSMVLSRWISPT